MGHFQLAAFDQLKLHGNHCVAGAQQAGAQAFPDRHTGTAISVTKVYIRRKYRSCHAAYMVDVEPTTSGGAGTTPPLDQCSRTSIENVANLIIQAP
jgi:hypothetical protein